MSNTNKLISTVIDQAQCPADQLQNLFLRVPLSDISVSYSYTDAEKISQLLNYYLGEYGFYTYPSADKTMVLVNDASMCQVIEFFQKNGAQASITAEQINNVKAISQIENENKIDLLWAQSGLMKKYYYLKQYGFQVANLCHAVATNSRNCAIARLSPTGASPLAMGGVMAISWTGAFFLSTVENYIPNTMPKLKIAVSGAKIVIAFPIRCVEWSSNKIFGFAENLIVGRPLPTNVTEVFNLKVGPKLKDIGKLKKPVLNWLIEKLNDLNK